MQGQWKDQISWVEIKGKKCDLAQSYTQFEAQRQNWAYSRSCFAMRTKLAGSLAVQRRFANLTHLLVLWLQSLVVRSYARNVLVFYPLIKKDQCLALENLFKSDFSDLTVVGTKPWRRAAAPFLLIPKPSCSDVRNIVPCRQGVLANVLYNTS